MRGYQKSRGFTLVEIMIVVTLIGILATLAIPAFKAAGLRAKGTAFVNDSRVFSEAFIRYAQENGAYPGPQRNRQRFPAGMEDYLSEADWQRTTPLGGRYSWDNLRRNQRNQHQGAIMVIGSTTNMRDMRQIDAWMDDGNNNTGIIQIRSGGARVYYMLEN